MTKPTPLDKAHAAMEADLADDSARLSFYERLADQELFLLLAQEPQGGDVEPELFELDDARYVLVFDREDRLSDFTGQPAPYAALPGRVIAGMLAAQKIGMGVNLGVAPSSILIPAEATEWLTQTLETGPREIEARVVSIHSPKAPERLIAGLETKLARAGGLAKAACLAGVTYADARKGHLLGFVDPVPGSERALAGSVSEALTFSGLDAGELDVGFFRSDDQIAEKLQLFGITFELPEPVPQEHAQPVTPGSDPNKPPILK